MILRNAYVDTHFSFKKQKVKNSLHMLLIIILFYFEKFWVSFQKL